MRTELREPSLAPIHEVSVSPRTRLFWSSSSYQHNRINECATKAAGQTIKGDALLVSDVSHIRHRARPSTDRHTACKPAILTPPSHLLSPQPDLSPEPAKLPIPISLQPPRGPGHLHPEAPPPDHGCRPGSSCAGPSCPPRWQDLPAGLVGEVGLALLSLGGGARDVIALSHVSRGTRQVSARGSVTSAAKHGNGSALGVHAQLLEASGQAESALRVWRRCAKAGDVEGQLRLGCACYQGAAGSSRDQDLGQELLGRGGEVTQKGYAGEADTLNHVLASAAIILGFMHFDGDGGMRVDQALACNLFKLAALAGSREAAQVLGWMFSTGQYGGSSM
ncbi:hypothetical protein V8C86DRAFT_2438831 [Haematococcus lacustris]